jgi:hypothetical protein
MEARLSMRATRAWREEGEGALGAHAPVPGLLCCCWFAHCNAQIWFAHGCSAPARCVPIVHVARVQIERPVCVRVRTGCRLDALCTLARASHVHGTKAEGTKSFSPRGLSRIMGVPHSLVPDSETVYFGQFFPKYRVKRPNFLLCAFAPHRSTRSAPRVPLWPLRRTGARLRSSTRRGTSSVRAETTHP